MASLDESVEASDLSGMVHSQQEVENKVQMNEKRVTIKKTDKKGPESSRNESDVASHEIASMMMMIAGKRDEAKASKGSGLTNPSSENALSLNDPGDKNEKSLDNASLGKSGLRASIPKLEGDSTAQRNDPLVDRGAELPPPTMPLCRITTSRFEDSCSFPLPSLLRATTTRTLGFPLPSLLRTTTTLGSISSFQPAGSAVKDDDPRPPILNYRTSTGHALIRTPLIQTPSNHYAYFHDRKPQVLPEDSSANRPARNTTGSSDHRNVCIDSSLLQCADFSRRVAFLSGPEDQDVSGQQRHLSLEQVGNDNDVKMQAAGALINLTPQVPLQNRNTCVNDCSKENSRLINRCNLSIAPSNICSSKYGESIEKHAFGQVSENVARDNQPLFSELSPNVPRQPNSHIHYSFPAHKDSTVVNYGVADRHKLNHQSAENFRVPAAWPTNFVLGHTDVSSNSEPDLLETDPSFAFSSGNLDVLFKVDRAHRTHPQLFRDVQTSNRACKCKNTNCLKLYCYCFQRSMYCNRFTCRCKGCQNVPSHSGRDGSRDEAIALILNRRMDAFDIREKKRKMEGCGCRKTRCLTKYCACFSSDVVCSSACKCMDCWSHKMDSRYQVSDSKPYIQTEHERGVAQGRLGVKDSEHAGSAGALRHRVALTLNSEQITPALDTPFSTRLVFKDRSNVCQPQATPASKVS